MKWSECSEFTEYKGIKMYRVGGWLDLAVYYKGSDGNIWAYSLCTRSWSNEGEGKGLRGEL